MKFIIAGVVLYGGFFWMCYLGTGGDKKNMKSFYSYPDVVQNKIRQNDELSSMIPVRSSFLKSFLLNMIIFTFVFIIIGYILGLSEFIQTFTYLLVLGEGLNLFDLVIIDWCWWSRTSRTHFTGINEEKDYRGLQKHYVAFLRGIPIFICVAMIAATVLNVIH